VAVAAARDGLIVPTAQLIHLTFGGVMSLTAQQGWRRWMSETDRGRASGREGNLVQERVPGRGHDALSG
jgi:hypothetical protein